MSGQQSSMNIKDSAIEKWTPSLAKGIAKPSYPSQSANHVWSCCGKSIDAPLDPVRDAVIGLLPPFREHLLTVTGDNGKEFVEHERISRELDTDFFFAHPFATWER